MFSRNKDTNIKYTLKISTLLECITNPGRREHLPSPTCTRAEHFLFVWPMSLQKLKQV